MTAQGIPVLVAHRGYLHRYPENTWLAIEAALQAGACWVEFDIQLCADGEFILLHDDNLLRTAGIDQDVFASTGKLLQHSVHEPARFGDSFAPLPLSTLQEVIGNLAAYPAARAMVEVKQESIDHWGLETVMSKLATQLTAHPQQYCVISYNADALRWCRHHSQLQTGWVLSHWDQASLDLAAQLGPEYLICNARKIPADALLADAHWQWMVYDITDPDEALAWKQRGVALVETADIGGLIEDPRLQPAACAKYL
jgi:glycerophosphoryl diester phosphodiesterase